jgi:aryl carrier-like protein
MARLFGGSKEKVLSEIRKKVDSSNFIQNGIDSLRDENLHQRFKELFGRNKAHRK